MLRAWLLGRFGAQADIDDIVQESYVRVLRARGIGDVQAPKAFLFATARNLALDQVRHRHVACTEPLVENDVGYVLDEGDGVAETVARNQELALLTEAIQSLPARCRQIFTLRKLYGLSQREIAVRLGIAESTVSNQIVIGVEKCTDFFAERGDGKARS